MFECSLLEKWGFVFFYSFTTFKNHFSKFKSTLKFRAETMYVCLGKISIIVYVSSKIVKNSSREPRMISFNKKRSYQYNISSVFQGFPFGKLLDVNQIFSPFLYLNNERFLILQSLITDPSLSPRYDIERRALAADFHFVLFLYK